MVPAPTILDLAGRRTIAVPLPGFLSSLTNETLLVLAAYGALAGAYLVAVPLALMAWMTSAGPSWARSSAPRSTGWSSSSSRG